MDTPKYAYHFFLAGYVGFTLLVALTFVLVPIRRKSPTRRGTAPGSR